MVNDLVNTLVEKQQLTTADELRIKDISEITFENIRFNFSNELQSVDALLKTHFSIPKYVLLPDNLPHQNFKASSESVLKEKYEELKLELLQVSFILIFFFNFSIPQNKSLFPVL